MKDRGKGVEDDDNDTENVFVGMQCKKHPYSSSIGICAECLKDRLVKLVCSECGEQRLSSCSCSDFSSYQESSSCVTGGGGDVGSVGRISFLIENEKKPRKEVDRSSNDVILLRRSASSCVEVKKHNGFSKIKRFFKKRKEKDCILDDKNEVWVSDILGVSRSRSLCSFRGNGTDEGSEYRFSSAKISDATTAGGGGGGRFSDYDKPRKSGFRGVLETSEPRNSGYSCVSYESEPRKSGFRGLYDEHEPRKSGFKGVLFDASEPRNSGFSAVSYDSDPRKSGYRSLLDEPAEARKSGFSGVSYDSEIRKSGFRGLSEETEARKSGFSGVSYDSEIRKSGCRVVSDAEENTKKGCPIEFSRTHSVPKTSDFHGLDDSAFIDLNLGSTSSKTEIPLPNMGLEIKSLRHLQHNGGSCRMTVNESLHIKESTTSSSYNKVWKWLSKHYGGSRISRKKCEDGKTSIFLQKF